MERTVSATEARIRFGQLMQQVVESKRPIVVERGGKPHVVVLSVAEYERLRAVDQRENWREKLEQVIEVGARINARRGGHPLTPAEEVIRQIREGRDGESGSLR